MAKIYEFIFKNKLDSNGYITEESNERLWHHGAKNALWGICCLQTPAEQ